MTALLEHKHRQEAHDQEMAAFAGYSAAVGVAKWFKEGIPSFDEFYSKPKPAQKEPSSEEYIARYESWT